MPVPLWWLVVKGLWSTITCPSTVSTCIKEVMFFICNLRHFTASLDLLLGLDLLSEQRFELLHPAATHWNYNSPMVSTTKEYYKKIYHAVSHIIECDDWGYGICECCNWRRYLSYFPCAYMLECFCLLNICLKFCTQNLVVM